MTQDANDVLLNPATATSAPAAEPRIALAMEEMLALACVTDRQLDVWLNCVPVAAETDGDRITAVTLRFADGDEVVVSAPHIIDATELGDLLAGRRGARHRRGEPGADRRVARGGRRPGPAGPAGRHLVLRRGPLPGEDHTIARPADYDFWRAYQADFWPGKQLGWKDVHPITLETRRSGHLPWPRHARAPGDFPGITGASLPPILPGRPLP
ncbi:MAG: FAD-dependent oxidoreductase [Caldilineaceae bacterium]